MRETQALYLSIIDAAVHGPERVSTPDVADILGIVHIANKPFIAAMLFDVLNVIFEGVSKNSISRVKKFSMIQANYGRKVSDSEVWKVLQRLHKEY